MTLKEIEEYKDAVLQILFDVQVSIHNAKYLGTSSSENENWVKKHGFFRHYFSQMRFILIIQLAKLFSNSGNESYSFQKFINRLDSTPLPKVDELNRNKISDQSKKKELITELRSMLDKLKGEIQVLMELRNNFYAHGKRINKHGQEVKVEKEIPLSWKQLESLTELAFDFYNRINGAFYDGEFIFPNKSGWSPEWVVKRAAETRNEIPFNSRNR
ncbi:hypothetical protein J2X69_003641 [Algoriphagus sp. 4150]|uniref:AbiU2 domain-containing protein n=1 Tax=Algoriphagus sp. 4150 TaxID=2817756 RepID=UPI002854E30D|nr:hypothetical protein [Algoriphagus sp. 4150]MDR7131280.1 hypothetical protein [Algoriphagus sp. 4150]